MTVSVELRWVVDGPCFCGIPRRSSEEPHPRHNHWVECDYGAIEYPNPRPDRGEVGHLMLVEQNYVSRLLDQPNLIAQGGRIDSATVHNGRTFAHVDYRTMRWTWELFDAHFSDGEGPYDMMLGVWRD